MKLREIKQLKKVKLNKSEKAEMRRFLSVRIAGGERHIYQKSFLHFNLFNKRNMLAGILAIILLITGGGTSLAAEAALPGDVLYPVKIEVNEKVLSALATKEEKKADWSTRQAERRLEEAAKLAEKGKLDSDKSSLLADRLKKHLDKTNDLVKKLEDKGNIQAATKINAHLKYLLLAHIQVNQTSTTTTSTIPTATTTPNIILTTSTTASTSTIDIEWKNGKINWGKLQKEIRAQLASSTAWQIHLQDQMSTSTAQDYFKAKAAAGVKKAAENKLEEVNKYFEHKKDSLSAEAKTAIQIKLNEAKNVKTQADQKLKDGQYVEAFKLYHESMTLAQNAKSLIQDGKQKTKNDDDTASSTRKRFDDDDGDDDDNTTSTARISDDDEDDEKDKSDKRGRGSDKSRR